MLRLFSSGYLLIYVRPGTETVDYYTLTESKRELQNNYDRGGNYSDVSCKQDNFEDILLVIAFVDLLYDSIPYLEKLYRHHFPNIMYCGPGESLDKREYNIVVVDMLHGVTVYECLSTAMRTHPGFTGYLFMRNDVLLNFRKIASFNKSRLWESSEQLGSQVMFQQPRETWIWWYTPWGLKACEQAYKDIIYLSDVYKRAIIDNKEQESSWDVENSLNALLWNGHGVNMCYRSFSNPFYIPSVHAAAFEKLTDVFQKQQVYIEIAVPTIIRMLDLSEKAEQLSGINLGSLYGEERAKNDDNLFWRHLTPNISYIRPVVLRRKYSAESRTTGLIEALLNRLNRFNYTGCSEIS